MAKTMGAMFDKLKLGDSASITKTITGNDIKTFAEITGDFNPLHLDEDYAESTMFGERIAHGMLTAGLISAVIGNGFGGPGGIYLSQDIRFRRPVYIGDTITATCTVIEKDIEKNQIIFDTTIVNQKGEKVLTGSARLLYPKD